VAAQDLGETAQERIDREHQEHLDSLHAQFGLKVSTEDAPDTSKEDK